MKHELMLYHDGGGTPRLCSRDAAVRRQYVYVMAAVSTGLLKIGIAVNVRKRASALRGGATQIEIVHTSSEPIPFARIIEREAHRQLRDCHVHGEWFRCSEAEALAAIGKGFAVWRQVNLTPVSADHA